MFTHRRVQAVIANAFKFSLGREEKDSEMIFSI